MRIDKLGAHLEAYIETFPTIIALRLCGRYGTGPQCHINKLPVELINAIETFVVDSARVEALETWSSEYKCFEVRCDLVDDHFTYKHQHVMYHEKGYECRGISHCPFRYNVDAAAKHREVLLQFARDVLSAWTRAHDINTRNWAKSFDTEHPICIFNKRRELVRNHFGIDVWTSNVRLPPLSFPPVAQADKGKRHESQNTTVAYMTLPNNVSSREDWLSGIYDRENMQSGYAMPVKLDTAPTKASLRRFPRAMSILGVNVFIHPTQKGTAISPPHDVQSSGINDTVDGSAADWPQLTLLTKNRIMEQ